MTLPPGDVHNAALLANAHPPDWVNPEPASSYNLVVIGGGTAGLVTAAGAAGLGARVALVEKHLLGGDCLNYGCVPSKALLRAGKALGGMRVAEALGIRVPPGTRADFPAVMERMRRLRAALSPHDSAERFRSLGVDVFLGQGQFTSSGTIEVDGKVLNFNKAVIATGARAAALPIPGLAEAGALTNESVFSLTDLPRRLAVIGAGPIGCEMAQAFRRFGAEVWLLEVASRILIREDPDAAERIQEALLKDGIRLMTGVKIIRVERRGADRVVHLERDGKPEEVPADAVLVGVGRAPNVEGLGLDRAGVAFDKGGVKVDDHLRTANPRIYAAGDICSPFKFTHAADAMARIVIQNALFMGRARASALTIPWCTYTDPEIAHVGMYEKEARDKGLEVKTFIQELRDVDRAVLDGEEEGFVKVHTLAGTDRILGATVVARHAGEMISELTLAMVGNLGLGTIAKTIHPYPTQAEAIKRVGDAYTRTRLTPFVKTLFRKWLSWRR